MQQLRLCSLPHCSTAIYKICGCNLSTGQPGLQDTSVSVNASQGRADLVAGATQMEWEGYQTMPIAMADSHPFRYPLSDWGVVR